MLVGLEGFSGFFIWKVERCNFYLTYVKEQTYPTDKFTIFLPQNPSIGEFCVA